MSVSINVQAQVPLTEKRWDPIVGEEFQALSISADSRTQIMTEAIDILSRCVHPQEVGKSVTGLVTGYVQSGKTQSFISVMALARDNDYRVIIVMTGTLKNLHAQTVERLRRAFRIDERTRNPWRFLDQPSGNTEKTVIEQALAAWGDPTAPASERKTLLITILKNKRNIKKLSRLLERIDTIKRTQVLFIDDEGDQAGLNTLVKQGRLSPTYAAIKSIRSEITPSNSYLCYTATPQANLLLRISDCLSPDFPYTLTPGTEYTGGKQFFGPGEGNVRIVPLEEVERAEEDDSGPPLSLVKALKFFIVATAIGYKQPDDEKGGNRSMLVHPSRLTDGHQIYERWINARLQAWQRGLGQNVESEVRSETFLEFKEAFEDYGGESGLGVSFEELQPFIAWAVRSVLVKVVNSDRDTNVDWKNAYAWVLVGGQALERGFTVNGLVVTYMTRPLGMGYVDSIQQRARFFGYHGRYLRLCRIFLTDELRRFFEDYIKHEENMREQLRVVQNNGMSLNKWRRMLILSSDYRPTRANVLATAPSWLQGDGWTFVDTFVNAEGSFAENNSRFVERFLDEVEGWSEMTEGDLRGKESKRNEICYVPIDKWFQLFSDIVTLDDEFPAIRTLLFRALEKLEAAEVSSVPVIRMAKGEERMRNALADGRIEQIMQGPQYAGIGTARREVYPGDNKIYVPDSLTLQISKVRPRTAQGDLPLRYVIGVHTPSALAESVVTISN